MHPMLKEYESKLHPWQKYFFTCFKEEEFVELPEEVIKLSAMYRYATWDNVVHDTVIQFGAIAASTLSMLFKPKVIVEMGVRAGFTTLLLCKLNPNGFVHGVDKFAYIMDAPSIPIGHAAIVNKVPNLELHIQDSWTLDMQGKVNLCFIDAEHIGDAPLKDTWRAWKNRNVNEDWCIAWDDYHPNNPDVYNMVNDFVKEVGYPLQKIASWYWIGNKTMAENDLAMITT